jgi:hypothetical protein
VNCRRLLCSTARVFLGVLWNYRTIFFIVYNSTTEVDTVANVGPAYTMVTARTGFQYFGVFPSGVPSRKLRGSGLQPIEICVK